MRSAGHDRLKRPGHNPLALALDIVPREAPGLVVRVLSRIRVLNRFEAMRIVNDSRSLWRRVLTGVLLRKPLRNLRIAVRVKWQGRVFLHAVSSFPVIASFFPGGPVAGGNHIGRLFFREIPKN